MPPTQGNSPRELRGDPRATQEASTHPGVGRHQRVRSERRGAVGRERLGLGDEGVVALVVDARVYKPAVHAPGAVPCGNTGGSARRRHPRRPPCEGEPDGGPAPAPQSPRPQLGFPQNGGSGRSPHDGAATAQDTQAPAGPPPDDGLRGDSGQRDAPADSQTDSRPAGLPAPPRLPHPKTRQETDARQLRRTGRPALDHKHERSTFCVRQQRKAEIIQENCLSSRHMRRETCLFNVLRAHFFKT